MGAFLSAFKTREAAEKAQKANEGVLYTWDELISHLSKN